MSIYSYCANIDLKLHLFRTYSELGFDYILINYSFVRRIIDNKLCLGTEKVVDLLKVLL